MPSFWDEAEVPLYFTGQASAAQPSHASLLLQQYSSDSAVLSGVGTHFDSRKGSYDSNVDISEDEASTPQRNADATTPHSNQTSWLPNSPVEGGAINFPPTPRPSPVQELPWLSPSGYPEFERQRDARERRKVVFDPQRRALEDTPRGSPTGTAGTSLEAETDVEDEIAPSYHTQDLFSIGHTPSHHSLASEEDEENQPQNGLLGEYLHEESNEYLPED